MRSIHFFPAIWQLNYHGSISVETTWLESGKDDVTTPCDIAVCQSVYSVVYLDLLSELQQESHDGQSDIAPAVSVVMS